MATGDYCTIDELKRRIWPDDEVPDDVNDAALTNVIAATSTLINATTGRRFWSASADETRYYTAEHGDVLYCADDILTVTSLSTDADGDGTYEDVWTTADYVLCPDNAAANGQPYTWIEITAQGGEGFPRGIRRGVKIVGTFGYSAAATSPAATPAIVKEACLLQCTRLFERRNSPYGMIGNPVTGMYSSITALDPDIKVMLAAVTRMF